MIYVLELEWRGEKAVLVIEIALQNIFFGCILFNSLRCIFITLLEGLEGASIHIWN